MVGKGQSGFQKDFLSGRQCHLKAHSTTSGVGQIITVEWNVRPNFHCGFLILALDSQETFLALFFQNDGTFIRNYGICRSTHTPSDSGCRIACGQLIGNRQTFLGIYGNRAYGRLEIFVQDLRQIYDGSFFCLVHRVYRE